MVIDGRKYTKLIGKSNRLRKQLSVVMQDARCDLPSDLPSSPPDTLSTSNEPIFPEVVDSRTVLNSADVIITVNEVNRRHGTGVLIEKIFQRSSNILSIRAHNHYNGEQEFGDLGLLLPTEGLSRSQVFQSVLDAFGLSTAGRILCVPFSPDEVKLAIAVKELFDAPLCTYIMDDNNVCSSGIPDVLIEELLTKSSLRLAISPELQQAYQRKYNLKFWILPPVVSDHLILKDLSAVSSAISTQTGILIGNIWGQRWLDLLRQTIRSSGFKIHWYCNSGTQCSWLKFDQRELEEDGITIREPVPEAELAVLLKNYSFALLPSGTLDEDDDNRSVAQLSLPTRVPFIMATSHTPIIVLGSNKTASGRFVNRFKIGVVSPYESASFRKAVEVVTSTENQLLMRKNAHALASVFSDEGIANWIWQSLSQRQAINLKFEELMPPYEEDVPYYVDPPSPQDIFWGFVPDYQAIQRLTSLGFAPDFVVDVGASTGIWSKTVVKLLPSARFILVEPLLSQYDPLSRENLIRNYPNFEIVEAALSNHEGRTSFQVSSDLYGSSLLHPGDRQDYKTVEVNVTTLDALAQQRTILGRGFLKVDVQCAEHLVIEGGLNFLSQIDAVQLELSLLRLDQSAKTFLEMIQWMDGLGFRYFDDIGHWRNAVDGQLIQKDVLFLRKSFLID